MKDILDVENALLEIGRAQLLEGGDVLIERLEQGALDAGAGLEAGGHVALDGAILHDHQLGLKDGAVILTG